MVLKVQVVEWRCKICGDRYSSRREALDCQRRGLIRPRYRVGDIVRIKRSGIGIVAKLDMFSEGTLYLHDEPGAWVIGYIVILEKAYRLIDTIDTKELLAFDGEFVGLLNEGAGTFSKPPRLPNVRTWEQFHRHFRDKNPATSKRIRRFRKLGVKAFLPSTT